jgi:hypothetical protein
MVGAYFFAFNLSIQPLRLFAASLEGVLMASLSHLQLDPERQVRAFLRAASLMAVLIVPICFVQALLFDPVFRLVFPDGTMHDAIRPGQIISVGMAIWAVYGPTASLLKAQGRFRTFAIMATIYATGFIVAVTLAARFGTVAHVAAAVGLCMIIDVPIKMYVAVRPGGAGWSDVLGVLGLPFAIGILAAGAAGGLAMLVPDVFGQNIARIVIVLLVTGAIYLPLIRATSPASWNEALEQLQRVLPQRLIRRLEVPLARP